MVKTKVAIIGAGPSGFAAAEALRTANCNHDFEITIYESNDYVGGKCRTVLEDGSVANGKQNGYEAGAGFIPEYAKSYADLMAIIRRYNIPLRSIEQSGRQTFDYVVDGKPAQINQLRFGQLFAAIRSYASYIVTYTLFSGRKHTGFTRLSSVLQKPLSLKTNAPIFLRYAHVVQGFGYADMDDPYLRPPLPYYHRYLEPRMKPPLSMVNGGTQSIWAKVASTYPEGAVRLNTQVLGIRRSEAHIEVVTDSGQENYDYLVVATTLQAATVFMDFETRQKQFIQKMKYNHYITVRCKASGLSAICTFNLSACSDRNQIGRVLFCYNENPENHFVTLNLYVDPKHMTSDQEIINMVQTSLEADFGATLLDPKSTVIYRWEDYFGHMGNEDLRDKWYDKFDAEFQGIDRTIFVGGGLHMETVGSAVQYATKMTKKHLIDKETLK